jgi:putative FmdB family regulatory protein
MPLYDFVCAACNSAFEKQVPIAERNNTLCKCGARAVRQISRTKDDWFRSFVTEDFNGQPIEVKSKEHYRQLCKEHGVYAPHVFGQGYNISEV